MSVFTKAEIDYLDEQRLGRLATVGPDGVPHVVPIAFRYNPDEDTIDIGGRRMGATKKFRDVARTGLAAIVVDDVRPPWRPRMIEVRGQAEALGEGGSTVMEGFSPELIRIRPRRIISWGLD
ncbi:MAG TPA: PPOX class F420-dependent oxidoreductase, partial [Actinomycetota bacterium]